MTNLTVYEDDGVEDVLERLQFILNEMGIKMRMLEVHDDSVVYSFIHAERLGDAQEES